MSDVQDDVVDVDEAEVDLGVEEVDEAASEVSEPEERFLDLDVHGNDLVAVKVGGEVVYKTLAEIASEGMRQQDYTRKTQEVAEQRRAAEELRQQAERALQLEELARSNPRGFRDWLDQQIAYEDEPADPKLSAMERQLQMLQEREMQRDLDYRLDALAREYGDDWDQTTVLELATAEAQRLGDRFSLEYDLPRVARDALHTKLVEKEARQIEARRRAAADAQRKAKASEAAALGGGRSPAAVEAAPARGLSVQELGREAALKLGYELR